jgi:protein CWC15
VGSANQGGYRYHTHRSILSARELPAHTNIKYRAQGQGSVDDVKLRDLRAELAARETSKAIAFSADQEEHTYDDQDEDLSSAQEDHLLDEDEDEDEDEEQLLRLELEKIKREKEEERKRLEEEEKRRRESEAISPFIHNPLDIAAGSGVKRRWDDDVVFRNQAKDEAQPKRRFINDTIRNDFHVKFMKRYIK